MSVSGLSFFPSQAAVYKRHPTPAGPYFISLTIKRFEGDWLREDVVTVDILQLAHL